jgi:hypothetical protein
MNNFGVAIRGWATRVGIGLVNWRQEEPTAFDRKGWHEPDTPRGRAVKTTRLNPRPRREKSGETLLGHRSHPRTKVYGDQSMIEKRSTGELARPAALQGPRDRAKAGLLEPQIPAMEAYIPCHSRYGRGRRNRMVSFSPSEFSFRRATASEAVQGNERGAYLTLTRSTSRDTGSPKGREAQGDGAVVVVRGRESRPHGEGPQVLG